MKKSFCFIFVCRKWQWKAIAHLHHRSVYFVQLNIFQNQSQKEKMNHYKSSSIYVSIWYLIFSFEQIVNKLLSIFFLLWCNTVAGEFVKYIGRCDDGVLALSNYRICLKTDTEISIPLGVIEYVTARDLFQLVISCKDASTFK